MERNSMDTLYKWLVEPFVALPAMVKYLLALGCGLVAIDPFSSYAEAVGQALHLMT